MVLPLLARLTAPAPQTLHTHSPTPSTVSFTVSTRARRTTLAARLLTTLSVLLRLVLSTAALLSLWLKHRLSAGKPIDVLLWVLGGQWTTILLRALGGVGWLYLGVMVAGVLGWAVRRGYTEESLTLLRGLGVQTCSSAPTYLQPPRRRFIPTTQIQDVLIHEAFRGFEVRFYLAIVVQGEEDVVVVFPGLLPRRELLEEVWRGTRACLWEGGGGGASGGKGEG